MFCKWCGTNIQFTDKKCPSCGRETPSMSDCGGLYNLKYGDHTPPHPKTPVPTKHVSVPQCPIVEKMEPKYANDRKAAKVHHSITLTCFCVVLAAVILCVALIFNLYCRLNETMDMVAHISDKLVTNTEIDNMENLQMEVETETDKPIENVVHRITLGVTIKDNENIEIGTSSDFGTYTTTAKVITANSKDDKPEKNIDVSWVIGEKEEYINLDVISRGDDSAATIGVKCETNVVLFADATFAYSWQYCDKDLKWVGISDDLLITKDGYYGITCEETFWNTVGLEEGLAELRCVITTEDENGDVMALTVDGFTVSHGLSLG